MQENPTSPDPAEAKVSETTTTVQETQPAQPVEQTVTETAQTVTETQPAQPSGE